VLDVYICKFCCTMCCIIVNHFFGVHIMVDNKYINKFIRLCCYGDQLIDDKISVLGSLIARSDTCLQFNSRKMWSDLSFIYTPFYDPVRYLGLSSTCWQLRVCSCLSTLERASACKTHLYLQPMLKMTGATRKTLPF
jgi:hypothetical protein